MERPTLEEENPRAPEEIEKRSLEEKTMEEKAEEEKIATKNKMNRWVFISDEWAKRSEDIKLIESEIPVNTIEKQVNEIRNFGKEFKLVKWLTETQKHKEQLAQFDLETSKLNRYNNIVPCNQGQKHLKEYLRADEHTLVDLFDLDAKMENSKVDLYINANYIDVDFSFELHFHF